LQTQVGSPRTNSHGCVTDERGKARAIARLGAELGALERPQQQALVTAALGLPGALNKAQAIAGLVNGYQASRVRDYLR
jgi:hypothetical protein